MDYTLTSDELARFWAKVNKDGDCWTWTASIKTNGYGQFAMMLNGKKTMARTHRVAYSLAYGSIPDDKVVDHACRNRRCVNPAHLRLVTLKQNNEHRSAVSAVALSGIRGVHWDKAIQKWRASVKHNGRNYFAGQFKSKAEAHAAVTAKRLELFTHNDLDRAA